MQRKVVILDILIEFQQGGASQYSVFFKKNCYGSKFLVFIFYCIKLYSFKGVPFKGKETQANKWWRGESSDVSLPRAVSANSVVRLRWTILSQPQFQSHLFSFIIRRMYFIKGATWEEVGTLKPYSKCPGRQKCLYLCNWNSENKLFWGILRNRNSCRTFVEDKLFYYNKFLSNWLKDSNVYLWKNTTVLPTTPVRANFQILHVFIHLALTPCKKIAPIPHSWKDRLYVGASQSSVILNWANSMHWPRGFPPFLLILDGRLMPEDACCIK